jgi:hypothetical protein
MLNKSNLCFGATDTVKRIIPIFLLMLQLLHFHVSLPQYEIVNIRSVAKLAYVVSRLSKSVGKEKN